jgi:ankyrin repeat protein
VINRALLIATVKLNIPLMTYLVNKGANNIDEALHELIRPYSHVDLNKIEPVISTLINFGADVNTPLIGAAKRSDIDFVRYLIEKGATSIKEAILAASRNCRNFEVIGLLMEYNK